MISPRWRALETSWLRLLLCHFLLMRTMVRWLQKEILRLAMRPRQLKCVATLPPGLISRWSVDEVRCFFIGGLDEDESGRDREGSDLEALEDGLATIPESSEVVTLMASEAALLLKGE